MNTEFRAGERSNDRDDTRCQFCRKPADAYAVDETGAYTCKACVELDEAGIDPEDHHACRGHEPEWWQEPGVTAYCDGSCRTVAT